jgi:hypothetical protein
MKNALNAVALSGLVMSLLLYLPALASDSPPVSVEDDKQKGPQIRATLRIAHDDNVFDLTDSGQDRLSERDPANLTNGRLANMNAVSDRIVSVSAEFDHSLGRVFGRKTTLSGEVSHHDYQDNDDASYTTGQLNLTGSLGQGRRIRADVEFIGNRFRRNYLTGISDLNDNGNIPRSERQYEAGVYDEVAPSLAYRHRFHWRPAKEDLDLHLAFGRLYRDYDSPLQNRDRKGWFSQVRLSAEFNAKLALDFAYRHEDLESPGYEEVVLVDETLDGDLNGDGRIKGNAPLVTQVDRSRVRGTYRLSATFQHSPNWRTRLEYRHQDVEYTSSGNPMDVDHYGVTETEQRFDADVRWRFAKRWFLTLAYRRTDGEDIENLGRDQSEFDQQRVSLSVRHRFR